MKLNLRFAIFSATLVSLSAVNANADKSALDCVAHTQSVKNTIIADPSKVLEIVSAEVTASPDCACELVKAAIEGSKASVETVAAIVEAASIAAPEQMRLVSQCAVAVAPDSLASVQAVLAKLDPNLGESSPSAKSSKGSKGEVAAADSPFNPLDIPPGTFLPPTQGNPPGVPPLTPPLFPPPSDVTAINFMQPGAPVSIPGNGNNEGPLNVKPVGPS